MRTPSNADRSLGAQRLQIPVYLMTSRFPQLAIPGYPKIKPRADNSSTCIVSLRCAVAQCGTHCLASVLQQVMTKNGQTAICSGRHMDMYAENFCAL
eukprot:6464730-Amphidinium_carterae.1